MILLLVRIGLLKVMLLCMYEWLPMLGDVEIENIDNSEAYLFDLVLDALGVHLIEQ